MWRSASRRKVWFAHDPVYSLGVNYQDNCKKEVETYIQYMKDKHFYKDH